MNVLIRVRLNMQDWIAQEGDYLHYLQVHTKKSPVEGVSIEEARVLLEMGLTVFFFKYTTSKSSQLFSLNPLNYQIQRRRRR